MAKQAQNKRSWGGKREGSGRKGYTTKPTTAILLTLPDDLIERIDKMAFSVPGKTRSALVAELLAKALRRRR